MPNPSSQLPPTRKKLEALTPNLEAAMKALKSQLDMHFIFNSLNCVNTLIQEGRNKDAQTYLILFSGLVRVLLEHAGNNLISLKEELSILDRYLSLEKFRLGDRLNYTLTISEELDLETNEIPPLLIQPLLENAIWHGILARPEGGDVVVEFQPEGERGVRCSVRDNGVGINTVQEPIQNYGSQRTSMGMSLVQGRLQELQTRGFITEMQVSELRDLDKIIGTEIIVRLGQKRDAH